MSIAPDTNAEWPLSRLRSTSVDGLSAQGFGTPTAGSRLAQLRAKVPKPGEASFFFYEAHFKSDAVKVLPGEYCVDDEDLLIMTTLGSCIAGCLWDRHARVGGMNHFMLPEGVGDSGRYRSYAMELLINELLKRGATRPGLDAKVKSERDYNTRGQRQSRPWGLF